jgi:hypothetical protein
MDIIDDDMLLGLGSVASLRPIAAKPRAYDDQSDLPSALHWLPPKMQRRLVKAMRMIVMRMMVMTIMLSPPFDRGLGSRKEPTKCLTKTSFSQTVALSAKR